MSQFLYSGLMPVRPNFMSPREVIASVHRPRARLWCVPNASPHAVDDPYDRGISRIHLLGPVMPDCENIQRIKQRLGLTCAKICKTQVGHGMGGDLSNE